MSDTDRRNTKYLYKSADATSTHITDDSLLARIMAVDGAAADFDDNTDSLEALSIAIAANATDIGAITSSQTFTATETEACVAGDIAVMTDQGGVIPFSSLQPTRPTLVGIELANEIGGNDTETAVDWVSENIFVYACDNADSGNDATVTPCKQNTDGTVTVGSVFVVLVGTADVPDITGIGNGRAVIAFEDAGTNVVAYAMQVNYETLYIAFGAQSELEAVASDGIAICSPADDKFCCLYVDEDNSDGNAIVGTVNSSTLAITKGTKAAVGTGDLTEVSICSYATDAVACAFNDATGNAGFCQIGLITTTAIAMGTRVDFNGGDPVTDTAIAGNDSTHITIVYDATTNNSVTEAITASIASDVPTFGSPVTLSEGTDDTALQQIVVINSTYFMALWDNITDSKTGFSVSSISGTTVTAGSIRWLVNDIPPSNTAGGGKVLKINNVNDIVYLGISSSKIYAVMFDVGWIDDASNAYVLYDISGVAEDAAGTIIVDGVDEGNASGEDSRLTYFFDSRASCVRKKGHNNDYGYKARVRVLDTDCLKAIGG